MAPRKGLKFPDPHQNYHIIRELFGDTLRLSLGESNITLRGCGKFGFNFLRSLMASAALGRVMPELLRQELNWRRSHQSESGRGSEYDAGYLAAMNDMRDLHEYAAGKVASTVCEDV